MAYLLKCLMISDAFSVYFYCAGSLYQHSDYGAFTTYIHIVYVSTNMQVALPSHFREDDFLDQKVKGIRKYLLIIM